MLNTIELHNSEVVVVDTPGEEGAASELQDTETVSLALLDVDNGVRDFRLRKET